jgi:sulfotransferase family protein
MPSDGEECEMSHSIAAPTNGSVVTHVGSDSYLTIVSGLPRSGTSMMMRMLERGGMKVLIDQNRRADEDNPRGYYEFEAVKKTKDNSDWLAGSEGCAVKMVYRLLYDLPPDRSYRVLFMRRKLEEVLASQRTMLQRNGATNDGASDEEMARLFMAELNAFAKWAARQQHIRMIDVDYNRILREPRGELEKVKDFLGVELRIDAMVDVIDESLYRNRK